MSSETHGPAQHRPSTSDGFVVVAALWILTALATLAAIYSVYVIDTASGIGLNGERIQEEALVTAGLDLTVMKLTSVKNRPPAGQFRFLLGGANVAVDFRSEAGRIDLNMAPKELLVGMFIAIGARPDFANEYASRVLGWRTKVAGNESAKEPLDYQTAGLPYGPRLGPFPHPAELSLVLGLPPELVERALPLVTTYSGQAQINLLAAAPEVLAALPGMTPDRLYNVIAQRAAAPQNPQDLLPMLGPAQNLVTITDVKTTRVNVQVTLANQQRMSAEVVIFVPDAGDEPYGVLSWRDDLDQASEAPIRASAR